MEVTHFEIRRVGREFELIVHSVDEHGRKHAALAPDGRSPWMSVLGNRCRLNRDFRHLQRNAR